MKKTLLLNFILLIFIQTIFSQDDATVLNSFKVKIKEIDSTLSAKPIVLFSQNRNESSTGKSYYLVKIEKIDIKYDIQKTNSLVTPYTGFVTLTIKVSDNQNLGDVEGPKKKLGFSDPEKAKEVQTFNSCCSAELSEDKWCKGNVKATFDYQEGNWVYKSIDTEVAQRILNGTTRGDISRGLLNYLFNK